jgi:hypothetical protein
MSRQGIRQARDCEGSFHGGTTRRSAEVHPTPASRCRTQAELTMPDGFRGASD